MEHTFLTEIVILVLAGAVIAYACFRLGLVPIVGFLVAGVIIGPNALGLVRDRQLVDAAAEIGVIFLLFIVGIEFSLEKLVKLRRTLLLGGGLQVIGAAGLTTVLCVLAATGWRAGLFTGFLVALSSTVIVLKLLADRGETSTPHGQVALALLIFQDLAVVVMVLLLPMLAGGAGDGGTVVWALAKAVAIIALVLLVARRLMPVLLEAVARTCSPELFLLTVIAICFGTAYLTNLAGVSLSLGAFLGGLVVSESRFSAHAMSEILPLQILFSAVFFVSVGMLLDVGFLLTNLPLVILTIVLVLAVKVATTGLSVLALGYPLPVTAASALLLAQVGEFSFVLERAGRPFGLTPGGMGEAGSQTFIAATVVLMLATPLLAAVGSAVARRVAAAAVLPEVDELPADVPALENHVIVAGYGDAARRLVRVLHGSRVPYLITTLSPEGAREAEADGLPVLRGDATRQRTLLLAGADRAKVLVIADDDPATAHRIVAVARTVNPTMRILVRTRYIAEIEPLTRAGADRVIAEELESVVQLFSDVLRSYEVPPEEIDAHEETIRGGGYAALRARELPAAPLVECDLGPDCLDRRAVILREGAAVVGQSLAALALGPRFALRVESVVRQRTRLAPPPDDLVLQAGDEVTLAGTAEAFRAAAPLFRSNEPGEIAAEPAAGVEAYQPRTRVDTETRVELHPQAGAACAHLAQIHPVLASAPGCEDCLRTGEWWVHLRICMTCGHVGCCDSSPHKHATAHFHSTTHPIMKSLEPGEDWGWCFVEEVTL